MTEQDFIKNSISKISYNYGFDIFGVTKAKSHEHIEHYKDWINDGLHADMEYLERHSLLKSDPKYVMEGAKSVLCFGAIYNSDVPYSVNEDDPNKLYISRYALNYDYHDVLKTKLYKMMNEIKEKTSCDFEFRICTDSAPLLERSYALSSGLGWIGKNSCLINKDHGSFFFLAEVLVNIDLPYDEPLNRNYCTKCRRCIDACPTGAIIRDRVIDSSKCISYLTIENKGEIDKDLQKKAKANGNKFIFGCDVCQEVCPYNRKATLTRIEEFKPRPEIMSLRRKDYNNLTLDEFRRIFKKSPVKRAKYDGLMRNIRMMDD